MKELCLFFLCLTMFHTHNACSYMADYYLPDATNLTSELLKGYNKRVRGYYNLSEGTVIYIQSLLTSLVEFDDVNAKISFVVIFMIKWKDVRMMWNCTANNIPTVSFLQSDVWVPQLILAKPSEELKMLGYDWLHIVYTSDGIAVWSPGHLFHASCVPDITEYPFDTHVGIAI